MLQLALYQVAQVIIHYFHFEVNIDEVKYSTF